MKKTLAILLAMALTVALAACGLCETLYVDNRETDKIYPERLNLRAQPSREGAILGLYYTGAQVNALGVENDAYTRVEIGGMTGYMASEYLITADEAVRRYGEASDFGQCRAAEVDLNGMWMQGVVLREATDPHSAALGTLHSGDAVSLMGILDDWAYIAATIEEQAVSGYVPLDVLTDVGELKVSIISGAKADAGTLLYDAPNARGKEIMRLKNGTACFTLFGRKEGEWRRVRVGGVSGWIKYTQTGNLRALGTQSRSVVPYYPLQMQTKDDVLLYSVLGDKSQRYMTLGTGMKVEVLAECGDWAYVRTYEGGAGAFDCGDFGYMRLADLSLTPAGTALGIAQVDDGDLPAVLRAKPEANAQVLGALCCGAQVTITAYTQSDYMQVALGTLTGYVRKDAMRVLGEAGTGLSARIPQRATALADVVLQTEPKAKNAQGTSIAAGERVYMLGLCGDWAYVKVGDSPSLDMASEHVDVGFVLARQLNAPASTLHLLAYVREDKVNLRSQGDSKTGQIIGRLRLGELLRVAEYGNDWTCVVTPDGERGYVMTSYLTFGETPPQMASKKK